MRKPVKLSPVESEVLTCVDISARITVPEIAKQTGLKQHAVRYALQALTAKLKLFPNCWIDPYKLGKIPYRIFFSLAAIREKDRAALITWLRKLPEVAWIGEFSGSYHYGLALHVASVRDLTVMLDRFDSQFGRFLADKSVGILRTLSFLRIKLLSQTRYKPELLEYDSRDEVVKVDETDLKLIAALRERPFSTHQELSRVLGLASSSASYRLEKLHSSGVVIGYFYQYDYALFGLQSYLILVSTGGMGSRVRERMRKFALSHPSVMMFAHCIGSWDFEFHVAVEHARDILSIVQDIHDHSEGLARDIQPLTWIADFKG